MMIKIQAPGYVANCIVAHGDETHLPTVIRFFFYFILEFHSMLIEYINIKLYIFSFYVTCICINKTISIFILKRYIAHS